MPILQAQMIRLKVKYGDFCIFTVSFHIKYELVFQKKSLNLDVCSVSPLLHVVALTLFSILYSSCLT
jgi:hypothetical protein